MSSLVGITYGGASAGATHQDRLVLVGSAAIADLVLASNVGEWTDFSLTRTNPEGGADVATDADGFWFQQVSARSNAFHAVLQQEGLFIFGDIGEATVPAGPFTASQAVVRENSWFGSEKGRTPVIAGGLVCFLQAGGGDVRGFRWTEEQRKYEAQSLREICGDIFSRAVDMSWGRSRLSRADSIYVVDDSGSMAVGTVRLDLGYVSWTIWKPANDGKVLGATNVADQEVLLVEREGPSGELEVAIETPSQTETFGEGLMDCRVPLNLTLLSGAGFPVDCLRTGPCRVSWRCDPDSPEEFVNRDLPEVMGLAEWRLCRERDVICFKPFDSEGNAIGYEAGGLSVPAEQAGGDPIEIVLDDPPPPTDTELFVGLPYEAVIETLPFVARTQTGTRRGVTKSRIFGAYVEFVGQAPTALSVNGRDLAPRLGRLREGSDSQAFRIGGLQGWRRRTTLRIGIGHSTEMASVAFRVSG